MQGFFPLKSTNRRRLVASSLPPLLLLLALATVFLFGGDRSHFYRYGIHNWNSTKVMALAENLSPEHGFKLFYKLRPKEDGTTGYDVYSRFPVGGYLLVKLAILPFGDRLAEKVLAARMLMLSLFCATAVLAYFVLSRLVASRWIALAAVALAFSSHQSLYFADFIDTESVCGLFGFMLVFHGMVAFVQEGRFGQLLVKTGIALLLDWHVYALLLPFIVCGLCGWLAGATRNGASASSLETRGGLLVRRSRFLALGAFALLFGAAVLGFNFLNERLALGASGSFADLPTFQSMMDRLGLTDRYEVEAWVSFLELQFHRIGRMSIPYALSDGILAPRLYSYGVIDGESRSLIVAVGILATAGALLGSLFARQRMLLAVLALSGFCWALPMRHNTSVVFHDFESLYFIGVPLVFFSLALLGVRKLLGAGPVAGLAVAALAAFALSSHRMSGVGHDAEAAKRQEEVMADAAVIRKITKGESVLVPIAGPRNKLWQAHAWFSGDGSMSGPWALEIYLSGSLISYGYEIPESRGQPSFIVSRKRSEQGRLLTPGNRRLFLYEWFDVDASFLSEYRRLVAGDPMLAHFDLYLHGKELSYVRAPCGKEDTDPWFFLHVFPLAPEYLPEARRNMGFNSLDFQFLVAGGRLFDGKCLVTVELPGYDIARIRTGQYVPGKGVTWEVDAVPMRGLSQYAG